MTTRVRFYHNTGNPLELACELVAKAYASGRRAAVRVANDEAARAFDDLLWSTEPRSFVPHVRRETPLAAETPVVIGTRDSTGAWPHHDLLFNLADDVPDDFDGFRMVVEIVGQGDVETASARARWMHYKNRGAPLQAFDSVRREAL